MAIGIVYVMARTTDARIKAITTAEKLFRKQGYAATGLTQIIEESGAPKGSFYFHFPNGKHQLAMEVIASFHKRSVAQFGALAKAYQDNGEKFITVLVNTLAEDMSKSDWCLGCAAQVLAQELAPTDKEASDALEALFNEWISIVAKVLGGPKAHEKALALIAALEGARTLARVTRSDAPFKAVIRQFQEKKT